MDFFLFDLKIGGVGPNTSRSFSIKKVNLVILCLFMQGVVITRKLHLKWGVLQWVVNSPCPLLFMILYWTLVLVLFSPFSYG